MYNKTHKRIILIKKNCWPVLFTHNNRQKKKQKLPTLMITLQQRINLKKSTKDTSICTNSHGAMYSAECRRPTRFLTLCGVPGVLPDGPCAS